MSVQIIVDSSTDLNAAIAGGLLSIKPVIGLVNGQIEILGKARGSRQANNLLVKEIDAHGVDFTRPSCWAIPA